MRPASRTSAMIVLSRGPGRPLSRSDTSASKIEFSPRPTSTTSVGSACTSCRQISEPIEPPAPVTRSRLPA